MAKIIYNKTLNEYLRRFGNHKNLIRFTKQQVKVFNSKHLISTFNPNYLLEGRKWWFIGDTYYQVPSYKNKLAGAGLVLLGLMATTGVTLGVGQGVFHWFSNNGGGGGDTPTPTPVPPTPVENVKITFDAGEGQFEETNATKVVEVKYGTLWKNVDQPKAKHDDKIFKAYTINDRQIDDNYAFTKDETVKATYNDKYFTVTFDADEGKWSGGKTQTIKVKNHTLWKDITELPKTDPEKDDGLFNCWSLDKETKISDTYEIKSDTTVYAKYDAAVTLTFNANYGSWTSANGVSEKKVKVIKNKKWKEIKDKVPADPTRENFDFDKWHLSTSIAEDIDEEQSFSGNQEITCTWIAKDIPSKDLFEDDSTSWKEIVDLAENGFNALANTFCKGQANPTFIGKTRNLKFDDGTGNAVNYKVRVIDEQADEFTPEVGKEDINRATLTFEFVDCVNVTDIGFASEDKKSNKWSESNIENELNKKGTVENPTIFDRIIDEYDEGTPLKDKFITVNKLTDSSGTTSEKLFVPALSELGFTKVPGSETDKVEEEGYVYKYYKDNAKKENLYIKNKGGSATNYWLRSNGKNSVTNVWSMDNTGAATSASITTESGNDFTKMSVAPCFCLGKSNNSVNVTYSLGEDKVEEANRTVFFSGDDYKTTREMKYVTEKNTAYTAFTKDRDTAAGAVALPSVYKKVNGENWEFKHWYVASDKTCSKIFDDYLIQEKNLVLYPYFEKHEESNYKPGLTITSTSTNDEPVTVNFQFSSKYPTFQYSTDNGKNYTTVSSSLGTPITLGKKGDSVIVTSGETANPKQLSTSESDCTEILIKEDGTTTGGRASISGDLRTLIDYKNYLNISDVEDAAGSNAYAFSNLFGGKVKGEGEKDVDIIGLEDASKLELGFTNTSERAFNSLFAGCTSLIYAPNQLSPTGIKAGTYWNCFARCTSLKSSPILADVNSVEGERAYYKMFINCTSLKNTPKLFATKLGKYAYMSMFKYCTDLEVAPELPENIEVDQESLCGMFHTCTSLKTAPKKINTSNIISQGCCQNMFEGCKALKTAPEIQITELNTTYTLTAGSLYGMFNGCTNLSYIKIYFDLSLYNNNTTNWMLNVTKSSSSIFECPKNPSGTLPTGDNGIQESWKIQYF